MQPIQPPDSIVGSGAGPRPVPTQSGNPRPSPTGGIITPTQTGPTNPGNMTGGVNAAAAGSSILSITSTSTTMMAMSQQVGQFLGGVDSSLANNEYLKLLIAAMIMNALLAGGGSGGNDNAMRMLEELSGGRNSAMYISVTSTSQSISIAQSSQQIIQGADGAAAGTDASSASRGGNLNLTI